MSRIIVLVFMSPWAVAVVQKFIEIQYKMLMKF